MKGNDLRSRRVRSAESDILTPTARDNLHLALGAIYHALEIRLDGTPVDLRRGSIVSFAALLVAFHSGDLIIRENGEPMTAVTPPGVPSSDLAVLCLIKPEELLKIMPVADKQVLTQALLSFGSASLPTVLSAVWPASLHFAPDAPKSNSTVHRRMQGTYLTQPWLAKRTIQYAIEAYLSDQGISKVALAALASSTPSGISAEEREHLACILENLTLVDPACGIGIFLLEGFDTLVTWQTLVRPDASVHDLAKHILERQLYGVDRDPLAIALTKAVLWARGRQYGGEGINPLHLQSGDALLGRPFHGTRSAEINAPVRSTEENSLDWMTTFPDIAQAGGFCILVTNPPWEKLKLLSREFFEITAPEIATAPTAAARLQLMGEQAEKLRSQRAHHLSYSRALQDSKQYQFSASGDLNLYTLFVERALQLTNAQGSIGLLVPSGIATDKGMSTFFQQLREGKHLVRLHDFENRRKIFPDVDGRFKFCIFVVTNHCNPFPPIYSFFLHTESDLDETKRLITMDEHTIALINPNTKTVPVVRSSDDLEILLHMHRTAPIFKLNGSNGGSDSGWRIEYRRLFDMTNDSPSFVAWDQLKSDARLRLDGMIEQEDRLFARVYEGRMIDIFDHRAANSIEREGQFRRPTRSVIINEQDHADPTYLARPRYAIETKLVEQRLGDWQSPWFLGFKDIGSSTNRRTMIASVLPLCAAGNKTPLLLPKDGASAAALLLANLNSFAFDFALRQHIGNITLNWFMVRQCPVIPMSWYDAKYINGESIAKWVQDRVLQLTYTSTDLSGWARELGYGGDPYRWDSEQRRLLRIDLDAMYFVLYDLDEGQIARTMETFPIIKRLEKKSFGEFRLEKEIIAKWHELKDTIT